MTAIMTRQFRLSPHQREIWLAGGSEPAFQARCALRIDGVADPATVRRAVRRVIARHEILRTTFERTAGMRTPFQTVVESADGRWRELDATAAPESWRQLLDDGAAPDLGEGPLLRLGLARLGAERWVLTCALPALCADAATLANLIEEVTAEMSGAAGGDDGDEGGDADEEPVQYVQFSEWYQELIETEDEDLEAGRAFWARPAPPAVPPASGAAGAGDTFEPRSLALAVDPALSASLAALAGRWRLRRESLLLGAWLLLLGRSAGSDGPVVGKLFDGRADEELREVFGPLARVLPVAGYLRGDPLLREYLRKLEEADRQAREWQEYAPWSAAAPPVGFALLSWPRPRRAAGVSFATLHLDCCARRFELELACAEREEGLDLTLRWDPRRRAATAVRRLGRQLTTLLKAIVDAPEGRVGAFPILPAAERQAVVVELNDSRTAPGRWRSVARRFADQAERTPTAPAVVFEDRRLSYRELAAEAAALAGRLRSLGVGAERPVAILLERSVEMVVAIFGVLEAGAGYLPLDPGVPRARLAGMLAEARAAALVTAGELARGLPAPASVIDLERAPAEAAPAEAEAAPAEAAPESLAYLLFTSGSTGRPKGVAVEQRQLLNYVDGFLARARPPAGASFALVSTFAADLGNTMIFPALLSGGCLHVVSAERAADPGALADYFRRHRIDCLKIVPSHLAALLGWTEPARVLPRKLLVVGGEASPWPLIERVWELAPECRIFNHYGPTETTVGVSALPLAFGRGTAAASVPLGPPLANSQLLLLDRRLQPVPIGFAGELYLGGDGLARGYLHRPEATAERFLPHLFADRRGARLYRSGDQARLSVDGTFEFLGRTDHQVKIRGFRIETGEVETVLAAHPAVREARVLARSEGDGDRRLVAWLRPRGEAPATDELRRHLQERLPDYMVPAAFVPVTAWPLTANGKLDAAALPAPETAAPSAAEAAPRNSLEERLAVVWADVLGRERVGIDANFFTLGGDSILAIQVAMRVNRLGLELRPQQLFEHQTIARLAAALTAGEDGQQRAEQGLITGSVPLTPIQRWFFELGVPAPHHWNWSSLWRLREPVPPALLERMISTLLVHHDALRARFEPTADGWCQRIAGREGTQRALVIVDLGSLPAAHRRPALEAAAAALQRSLDLTAGPLVRVALLPAGESEDSHLFFAVHHLVIDGVSWRILLSDLAAAWEQLAAGREIALPAKTTSFRQWASRLELHARSAALAAEAGHWRSALPGAAPPLPGNPAAGAGTLAEERQVTVTLGRGETAALLEELPAAYRARIDEALATAVARAVAAWSGRPGVLIELEGHGREPLFEEVDLTRTVGWLTTHYPVWLEVGGGPIGRDLLAVKERLRGIPGRGIGYGLLRWLPPAGVARGGGDRGLAGLPEPEIKLNYLGRFAVGPTADRALPLAPSTASRGPDRDPRSPRPRALAIDGGVADGELYLRFSYAAGRFEAAAIEALAAAVGADLRALAAHCTDGEAGGVSPSDFPLAGISAEALTTVLAALPAPAGTPEGMARHRLIEDLYPASPLQRSLLYHVLAAAGTSVGFEQKSIGLRGELNVAAFERTWQRILDRHPVLRTAFVWDRVPEPQQVVYRRLPLLLERPDWRHLDPATQSRRLAELLAEDRRRGFDPERAPLLRFVLIRLADDGWHLVWSYSHLILDAWCRTLVLREMFAVYDALCSGREPELPAPLPFRDYVAWLEKRDLGAAEEFWRRRLGGLREPTPLVVDRMAESAPAAERAAAPASFRLAAAPGEALARFARGQEVTLNTILQAAWALLLGRYSGRREVVFGTTVAGRPGELAGADSILGMFINNLPVRVRAGGEAGLGDWLRGLQRRLAEQQAWEWCSPEQIQEWSGLAWGARLYESLLLVQNYPADELAGEESAPGLAIVSYQSRLETGYPLTVVAGSLEPISIRIFRDPRRLDAVTVERIAGHLRTLLEGFDRDPERSPASLELLTAAERQQLLEAEDAGVELRLLGRDLQPVPAGVAGELFRSGRADDVVHRSREAAERLLPDPAASPGGRIFRTGEWARRTGAGEIERLGTPDPDSRSGVPNLDRGWVEAALRRHPGVREVAVRFWTGEDGEEDERRPVAYLVPAPGAPAREEELRAFVRRLLPQRLVPGHFVVLDALPRDRDSALDRAALPAPEAAGGRLRAAFAAPRDPLEQMLVEVWEELFDLRPIGIRDDFFELGGHSLLGIRMLGAIPEHFARRLPLAILLRATTIEKLAAVLRREVEDRPWSPLVALRSEGSRRPLFCVHALGGEALCYRELAAALGPDQPFYALQARVWEADLEPHETIEEMAACYLEAIREVQPAGPYQIAGWSFGGLVALDIAQQLDAAGEEVGLLAILDTNLRIEPRRVELLEKIDAFQARHGIDSYTELWKLGAEDEEMMEVLETIKRMLRLPPDLDLDLVARYERIGVAFDRAKNAYRPRPFRQEITLFRATEGHIVYARDPTLGWGELAAGGLEIREIPGNHNNLVYRPHVRELAREMRRRLEEVAGPRPVPLPG